MAPHITQREGQVLRCPQLTDILSNQLRCLRVQAVDIDDRSAGGSDQRYRHTQRVDHGMNRESPPHASASLRQFRCHLLIVESAAAIVQHRRLPRPLLQDHRAATPNWLRSEQRKYLLRRPALPSLASVPRGAAFSHPHADSRRAYTTRRLLRGCMAANWSARNSSQAHENNAQTVTVPTENR